MNTQELNTLAAKAAKIPVYRQPAPSGSTPGTPERLVTEAGDEYDPSTNELQSRHLATALGLVLKHDANGTTVASGSQVLTRVFKADPASIRDAVVRAAVAVGERG